MSSWALFVPPQLSSGWPSTQDLPLLIPWGLCLQAEAYRRIFAISLHLTVPGKQRREIISVKILRTLLFRIHASLLYHCYVRGP